MKRGPLLLLIIVALTALEGCKSGLKKEEHELNRLLLHNLHFRRPLDIGADPQANYGDWDYETHPRPDGKFGCQAYPALFTNVALAAVRECLRATQDVKPPVTVSYRLKREIAPLLELEDLDEAPKCFQEALKTIPVPREIFFQSKEEGTLTCYSARLAPQVDDSILSLKRWLHKFRLNIVFPMEKIPQTDEETLMLLETWGIAPFWNPSRTSIIGRVVPAETCKKCMGDQVFNPSEGIPPEWP